MDAALLLLVFLWGTNFAVIKVAIAEIDVMAFTALRFAVASTVLAGLLRARGWIKVDKGDWPAIIGLGLIGHTAYQILFVHGLRDTETGQAALLLGIVPVLVALIGRIAGIDRLSRLGWSGVLTSFVGVGILVLGGEGEQSIGDLRTLASALAWALYTVFGRPLLNRYPPLALTALTMIPGAIALGLLGVPSLLEQDWSSVSARAWSAALYSTFGGLVVAYVIWYTGVQRIGGARTAAYSNLVPFVALAVGWLLLAERLTAVQGLGALVAILGVAMTRQGR